MTKQDAEFIQANRRVYTHGKDTGIKGFNIENARRIVIENFRPAYPAVDPFYWPSVWALIQTLYEEYDRWQAQGGRAKEPVLTTEMAVVIETYRHHLIALEKCGSTRGLNIAPLQEIWQTFFPNYPRVDPSDGRMTFTFLRDAFNWFDNVKPQPKK